MAAQTIFPAWDPVHSGLWGAVPLPIAHSLHEHELFSDEALAALLETYPREHASLVQWGRHGEAQAWREGEWSGLSGRAALEAIAKARVWINLRNAARVDPRYGALLEEIAQETARRVPGLCAYNWTMGILISSPGSRTLYHADLPGQSLLQIRGVKKIYVYPRAAPFIEDAHLEKIALSGVEASLPYQPWYDDHARVYEMHPGDMLHWPLNAPHRVDNEDCLCVSVTLEYFTPEIRRGHMVTMGNAILRSKFGIAPRSRATHGPAFWGKAVLQRALRGTKWVKRQDRARRPPEFRLDPSLPGGVAEIAGA